MRTLISLLSVTALTFSLGCAGGSEEDEVDTTDDPAKGVDAGAPTDVEPDATPPVTGGGAFGQACEATQEDPMGGCPEGFGCLSSGGGPGACFKSCESQQDASCSVGYDGPGLAGCFIQIGDAEGNQVGMACGVLCADSTGQSPCTAESCDGTCPGTWACSDTQTAGIKMCQ